MGRCWDFLDDSRPDAEVTDEYRREIEEAVAAMRKEGLARPFVGLPRTGREVAKLKRVYRHPRIPTT